MALTTALQSGLSGLMTSQKAIDVTSNNIVNSNTVGYTRKVHTQNSIILGGTGVGVVAGFSSRVVDEGILKQLNKESGVFGALSVKTNYMSRLEDLFGSPESNSSIAHTMGDVQSAFEQLATDVDNTVSQSASVSSLKNLIDKTNSMTDYIQRLRTEADRSIADNVTEVNKILDTIDKLNVEIMRTSSLGLYSADDYQDQRDAAYQRLSEIMGVESFTRSTGEMVIMTSSGKMLLDNEPNYLSHSAATTISSWNTYTGGEITGVYVNGVDITNDIKSGEMAGSIELRDTTLTNTQSEVDEMMTTLKNQLNLIHSRGVSYPSAQSKMVSDKTFLNINASLPTGTNPANAQTPKVNISDGDVRIIIFNAEGKEVASTSLVGELGFTSGDVYDPTNYPLNNSLLATIQNWLTTDPTGPRLINGSASINSDGKIEINTGASDYSIAFRDEASSVVGSEPTDATIQFDLDGDGVYDSNTKGFVNSFGFNNIVTNSNKTWLYDSDIIARNAIINATSPTLPTLTFSDEKNIAFGSVEIRPGDTIDALAKRINEDNTLNQTIKAEVIKEGNGYRLRIKHKTGLELVISEPTSAAPTNSSVLSQLGLVPSATAGSGSVKVRDDILASYDKISRGQVQYDSSSGEYFVSASDNTIANQFSDMFNSNVTFKRSGTLAKGEYSFTNYASNLVSQVSNYNANTEYSVKYQTTLIQSLSTKAGEISGVNLDEELSQLLVFEKSYNASAKVISTVNDMLDVLVNMIR
ncbi:MAG: Flagellar hook-associated protein 1 [Alphaproteobacteria bacterium ADurb.Bin438]|nr:MAG: Flagellar hook-associated protein 1 [Alphaproteobacteria bacterium ADurb.Bin438]